MISDESILKVYCQTERNIYIYTLCIYIYIYTVYMHMLYIYIHHHHHHLPMIIRLNCPGHGRDPQVERRRQEPCRRRQGSLAHYARQEPCGEGGRPWRPWRVFGSKKWWIESSEMVNFHWISPSEMMMKC